MAPVRDPAAVTGFAGIASCSHGADHVSRTLRILGVDEKVHSGNSSLQNVRSKQHGMCVVVVMMVMMMMMMLLMMMMMLLTMIRLVVMLVGKVAR